MISVLPCHRGSRRAWGLGTWKATMGLSPQLMPKLAAERAALPSTPFSPLVKQKMRWIEQKRNALQFFSQNSQTPASSGRFSAGLLSVHDGCVCYSMALRWTLLPFQ
jgi:hypothetical protein